MARRRLLIRDAKTARWLGYGAIIVGSYALWEAYEKRGRSRPFLIKWLPGP